MDKVAIITDSIACLPGELIEKYSIKIVGPTIYFDGRVYRDWLDISPSEAYQMLEKAPNLFATAPPPPTSYVQAYRELSTRAESILCITISSKMSTIYNVAMLAKEQVKEELPHTHIEVFDSRIATGAEGFIVLAAAKAASEGKGPAEVMEAARRVKENVGLIFLLDTISHAYRSGRIPKVASQVGGMLRVKPILTIRDGEARFNGLSRSTEKGANHLLEVMRKRVGGNPVHVAVHHTGAAEAGEKLKKRVLSEFNCAEIWLTEFSPLMGYVTGKGALGLAFYPED